MTRTMNDRKRDASPDSSPGYLSATLHPWPCFLFVVPLLLLYEAGIWSLGGHATLRNGADAWLRWGLAECGLRHAVIAPLLLVAILLGWVALRWGDQPERIATPLLGILLESFLFALALWGLGRLVGSFFVQVSGTASGTGGPRESFGQVLCYLGAGVYEETGFRLVLFAGLFQLLRLTEVSTLLALTVSAGVSALVFAAAHHIGPFGEAICPEVFVFRTVAGVYFALLFQFRGFGVAVGGHAAYDLLVGVSLG